MQIWKVDIFYVLLLLNYNYQPGKENGKCYKLDKFMQALWGDHIMGLFIV